jgi:hypothetical protein
MTTGTNLNGSFPRHLRLRFAKARLAIAIPWLITLLIAPVLPPGTVPFAVAIPVVPVPEITLLGTIHVLSAARSLGPFRLFTSASLPAIGNHRRLRGIGFAFCGISAFLIKILILRTAKLLGRLAYRLGGSHHPEIMFGKLKVALGHHIVAGGLRITAKLHVFLGNRLRRAPHLNVWPVALVNPVYRIAAAIIVVTSAAATSGSAIVAAAAALVVVLSLT